MELAVHFINFDLDGGAPALPEVIAATARAADEGGCSNFTVMDHYFQMQQYTRAEDPMLEGYSTLGFIAGQTERIKLGLLVTGVTYRRPGLLAKILTTLDVLSGGRAVFGLGAAWYEREHDGLGVPFPPIAQRLEMVEETIQICKQMWSDDDGPYEGKHFQLAETLCVPQPIQPGGPPIMLGGSGEQKTLKLVARYADACNLFATGPDVVRHKLEVLAGHCEAEGRDYDEIEKTALHSAVGSGDPLDDVDGFLRDMEQYGALGIDKIWVTARTGDPAGWTSRVTEQIVPRIKDA